MGETAWYVIHSKPRREGMVAAYLAAEGIQVFYPAAKITPVNPRASKERAFFPGYLFVHTDIDDVGVSGLQWIPGSMGLVAFGGEPAVVPESFILELSRRIAALSAARDTLSAEFKSGDTVEITRGPFAGTEAIFDLMLDDHQRAKLFIQWLGRRVTMQINANSIARKRAG